MIEKLSYYIAKVIHTDNMKWSDINDENEIEVLQYGIECIINMVIPILIFFIYSLSIHRITDMIIWLLSFLFLRNYLGGYHASSHIRCLVLSSIIGIISISLSAHMNINHVTEKLICLLIFMLIYLYNGPLLQDESYKTQYKKIFLKGIISFSIIILAVFILLQNNICIGNSLFMGSSVAFVLYFIELIKRKCS